MTNDNQPAKGTGKKIMIVVEEESGGHGFNVYLAGDKERISQGVKLEDMSPAEFWALKLFQICGSVLQQTGALQSQTSAGGKDA